MIEQEPCPDCGKLTPINAWCTCPEQERKMHEHEKFMRKFVRRENDPETFVPLTREYR